jgi:hypothetical protein
VGCAGYQPGRLRFGLIVRGLGLCGAAIPRASVHGAQELLALCRLQACTMTLWCDRSRAQLTQAAIPQRAEASGVCQKAKRYRVRIRLWGSLTAHGYTFPLYHEASKQ